MNILATYTDDIRSFHIVSNLTLGDVIQYGHVYMPTEKEVDLSCSGVTCDECIFNVHCDPDSMIDPAIQKYFPTLKSDHPELFV